MIPHSNSQTHKSFSYSKVEGLKPGSDELLQFAFLLVSADDIVHYKGTHRTVAKVEGFSRLSLNKREFPPFKIVLEDKIIILMDNSAGKT